MEAKETGFTDNLMALMNINTMSSSDGSSAGRPQKNDDELSDSALKTRNKASNVEKGGNV